MKSRTSSKSSTSRTGDQGLVYVFTGEGKGKTSAALGVAVRAVASGMRVVMVQWYKQASWDVSEHRLPALLAGSTSRTSSSGRKGRLQIYTLGKGFHIKNFESKIKKQGKDVKIVSVGKGKVVDTASAREHKAAAAAALQKATELLGKVDMLVLDEVNYAVKDHLIDLIDLIDLISKRGKTHLILTGRGAHPRVIAKADLVTEMTKIKHPFDKGKLAVKGLDF